MSRAIQTDAGSSEAANLNRIGPTAFGEGTPVSGVEGSGFEVEGSEIKGLAGVADAATGRGRAITW